MEWVFTTQQSPSLDWENIMTPDTKRKIFANGVYDVHWLYFRYLSPNITQFSIFCHLNDEYCFY